MHPESLFNILFKYNLFLDGNSFDYAEGEKSITMSK